MAQLTKGMYKYEVGLFGLHSGQMRGRNVKITHNSGWYNKLGERLGLGDLSVKDFRRISRELEEGELFIVLSEKDAVWNFITFRGRARHKRMVKSRKAEAPGVKYVIEHAMYVIARKRLYLIDRNGVLKEKIWQSHGLRFKVLGQEALRTLMKNS